MVLIQELNRRFFRRNGGVVHLVDLRDRRGIVWRELWRWVRRQPEDLFHRSFHAFRRRLALEE